jgi:HEXXH motif-containing protein
VLATLPGTTEGFAGILVHEIQHTKLGVLTDLVPLHDAGPEAVYRVPWRSDLRPFGGVLQGTYAHLALADFWLTAARRPGTAGGRRRAAQARGEASLGQVARALPVLLQSDRLTCTGREFTVRMKMHHAWLGRVAHHSAHDDRHCVTLSDIQ